MVSGKRFPCLCSIVLLEQFLIGYVVAFVILNIWFKTLEQFNQFVRHNHLLVLYQLTECRTKPIKLRIGSNVIWLLARFYAHFLLACCTIWLHCNWTFWVVLQQSFKNCSAYIHKYSIKDLLTSSYLLLNPFFPFSGEYWNFTHQLRKINSGVNV